MAIDLLSKHFNVVQEPLKPGDLFDLELTLANNGSDDAGSFGVDFYLSTNNFISTNDILLGSEIIAGLAGNSTSNHKFTNISLPQLNSSFWAKGNGNYYIGAIVDSKNEIAESNEKNNSNTNNNTGELKDSDEVKFLPLENVSFHVAQDKVQAGETIEATFHVENLADVKSENSQLEFYLSANDWISAKDYQLDSRDLSIEPLGNTGEVKATLTLPHKSTPFWRTHGNGTYYIGALINHKDKANQILDAGKSGNAQGLNSDAIDVGVPDLVDLAGESFEVTPKVLDIGGETKTIDVDFSVVNKQSGTAGKFKVDFYLSNKKGEWISPHDLKLGSYEVNELGGNQSTGTLTKTLELPSELNDFWLKDGKGTYMVGMIVNPMDDPEAIDETFFRKNNQNQGEYIDYEHVEAHIPSLQVDVAGKYFDVVNEPLAPGKQIEVKYSLENLEAVDAGEFEVDFYYSKNNYISHQDIYLGSETISSLGANSSTEMMTKYLSLPADIKSDGYIGMIVDGKNVLRETNEKNNSNQGETIDLDGPDRELETEIKALPDLDLKGKSFDVVNEPLAATDKVDVSFSVANKGTVDAGKFMVDIYASANEYISDGDYKLGSYEVASLAANSDTGEILQSYDLPAEDAPFWLTQGEGTYYIGAIVDSHNEVAEKWEDNNSNQHENVDYEGVEISNSSLIDLVGTHLIGEDNVIAGEHINVGFTVDNVGTKDAGNFQIKFYLSQNEYISTDDYELGTYGIDQGVPAHGSTGLLSNRFDLPGAEDEFWQNGDGTYYVGMIIDVEDTVQETKEHNNSNNGEFKDYDGVSVTGIDPDGPPDLAPASFDVVPDSLTSGQTFEVKYDLTNKGTGVAKDFIPGGFYLFDADYIDKDRHHDIFKVDVPHRVYPLQVLADDQTVAEIPGKGNLGETTVPLELPEASEWQGFSGGSGDYYIGLYADPFDSVKESNEANNSITEHLIDYEKVNINVI